MSPGDPSFDPDDIIPTNPWPSSDWMAIAVGAGVPGRAAPEAGRRVHRARRVGAGAPRAATGARLSDLAIVATLIAVAVVGAFDAVLLLPVPTLFAWTMIGALASSARPIREIALTPGRRRARARRRGLWACCSSGGARPRPSR